MRWKTVPQMSGCKRSVTSHCRQSLALVLRRTSRDVDEVEAERAVVVVWIQCLLVDIVRHGGNVGAGDHVDIMLVENSQLLVVCRCLSLFSRLYCLPLWRINIYLTGTQTALSPF